MAKIFGQLERAQIEILGSDPAGAGLVQGRIWFNSGDNTLNYYDGTAKRKITVADLNADTLAAAMTSTGTTSIAATMTTANANTIGAKITTAADTIAAQFTTTGTGSIVSTMSSGNADTIAGKMSATGRNSILGTVSSQSGDYTVLTSDGFLTILVTTSNTNRTITLPAAASSTHRTLKIKKVDSGTGKVTVDGNASETIDGSLTFTLVDQGDYVDITCDGSNWLIVDKGIGTQVLSVVKDEVGAGFGSTNTKIRRIETNVVNTGNAITRAISATNGNSYTINQSGVYAMGFSDVSSLTLQTCGISVNSAQLTTSISGITSANRLSISESSSNVNGSTSVTAYLNSGDVIRPHCDGSADGTSVRVAFRIQKIGL